MKKALLLALLVGGTAHASHTVCSAPELYYSSVRGDFGTPPPRGTQTGSLTLFAKNQLLLSETTTEGLANPPLRKHGIRFVGPSKEIAKSGNEAAGSRIYTDVAVVGTVAPFAEVELLRTPVVCEKRWAFVP